MSTNKSHYPRIESKSITKIEWGVERRARFLSAWKKGVKLIGNYYFGISENQNIDSITDIWDLKPRKELIEDSLHTLVISQGIFLASMYSFFNSTGGQIFLEQVGRPNVAYIPTELDKEYLDVIVELFINYSEWSSWKNIT